MSSTTSFDGEQLRIQRDAAAVTDQDDILGSAAVSQLPLPRYTQQEAQYLTVTRKALEDRAQYETPQDSLYFCPRTDPSAATYDDLLQHPVEERARVLWRDRSPPTLLQEQYDLLRGYFSAIREGSWDLVARLLQSGLVDANTTGVSFDVGCTPLTIAVRAKHKKVIILLLENGALVDGWSGLPVLGTRGRVIRTPLMIAAAQGDLPTVKWLMEGYGASDALIAPDGQLALRLAAEAGHEHVVAYLPTRRGGIYLRWKTKQAKLLSKIRRLFGELAHMAKIIVYWIPKWLISELLVYPIRRAVKWCWARKHLLVPFIRREVAEMPRRVERAVQKTLGLVGKIPARIMGVAKRLWGWLLALPELVRKAIKLIPGALRIVWQYVKASAITVWDVVRQVLERVASLLHTVVSAVVTFFRHLTFADLCTAVLDLLEAICVTLPVKLWQLVDKGWEVGYKLAERFFGELGSVLWWIVYLLWRVIIFLPEQLGRVVGALGEMVAVTWKELRVWWNPRAI